MMTDNRNAFKGRTIRWTAAILLVVAAFTAGVLWRGGRDDGHRRDAAGAGQPDATAAKAQLYYCSMHPQVRSPDPNDKCPICHMDLIPLPEDDYDGDDETDVPQLRLSTRAAALMDIRTWPVERRPVEMEIDLFGKIGYDESRLVDVVARTDAYVERLAVNTPWQPVTRGEVLAEFYSPAVLTAFRELLVANEGAEGPGNPMLEASRARLIRRGVSAAQVDEVLGSGEAPRTFRVESPAGGVVMPVTVREGEWLREGGHLTRVADLSRVWINLEAYERDLHWLAAGQTVRFSVAAYPGEMFEGEIIFLDPVVHERSRTVRLRVEADNPDGRLKPDMLVSATAYAAYTSPGNATLQGGSMGGDAGSGLRPGVSDDDGEHHPSTMGHDPSSFPLVIPASAPLITGRRALVYVRLPNQDRPTFEPRQIALGPRAGDVYVVREGLNEGDLVVVNGQFKIDSELQIRGRPSMMAPEGGAPTTHAHGDAGHAATVGPAAGQGHAGHDSHATHEPRLQTHCPVMGGPIDREFYHDHDGQRIYVCCPGCLDEVRERADDIIEEQQKKGIVFEKRPEDEGTTGDGGEHRH